MANLAKQATGRSLGEIADRMAGTDPGSTREAVLSAAALLIAEEVLEVTA